MDIDCERDWDLFLSTDPERERDLEWAGDLKFKKINIYLNWIRISMYLISCNTFWSINKFDTIIQKIIIHCFTQNLKVRRETKFGCETTLQMGCSNIYQLNSNIKINELINKFKFNT